MREVKFQVIHNGVSFGTNSKHFNMHRSTYTIQELVNRGVKPITRSDKILAIRQFTGMYDMDNKEIYEGDILSVIVDGEDFGDTHVVEYNPCCGGYIIDVEGCDYDMTTLPWASECHYYEYKVIGNKWEHKHLLEKGNK